MVKVIKVQDSLALKTKARLTTFEWEYPRFIHAEIMTHRVLGRNAGSSRAIPTMSAIELATEQMVIPDFAANKPGMQPGEILSGDALFQAREIWQDAAYCCIRASKMLHELKVHKQWANRMLEWFSPIKIVATATEWDNFLWLRNDAEAQTEFEQLANQVEHLLNTETPDLVPLSGAHVPYVDRVIDGKHVRYFVDGTEINREQAMLISASVCGQMSYRKADRSLEKALDMRSKFMEGRRVHASPFEHQGISTERHMSRMPAIYDRGVTHFDRKGNWHSGNLKGWIQHRHLIKGNTCTNLKAARLSE